ncbi:tail fiber assembly protein [Providencia rettgeri]
MELTNFNRYDPTEENNIKNVQFFISDEGVDFYDSFKLFKLKYKIGFDKEGIVRTVSEDVSAIYPVGLSIADVDSLPEGFSIESKWVFKGGAIEKYEPTKEECIFLANQQKQSLLNEAEAQITMLERKVRLNMATDDEKDLLTAWEVYSIKVTNINISLASDIEWPQKP